MHQYQPLKGLPPRHQQPAKEWRVCFIQVLVPHANFVQGVLHVYYVWTQSMLLTYGQRITPVTLTRRNVHSQPSPN